MGSHRRQTSESLTPQNNYRNSLSLWTITLGVLWALAGTTFIGAVQFINFSAGFTQFTIKNGSRSSSATSYLGPQFMKRPNLHVLLNTEVSRVLSSGQRKNGVPLLDTVQYTSFGTLRTVKSKREIILSAGAVNTPRILLHSGIGDSKDLSALGIKTILHNPSVGRNLSDHPIVSNQWTVNSTDTLESFTSNATAAAEDLALWQMTRTGPLSDGTANNIGWLRLASNASIFEHQSDPAAGAKTPHFELLFSVCFQSQIYLFKRC